MNERGLRLMWLCMLGFVLCLSSASRAGENAPSADAEASHIALTASRKVVEPSEPVNAVALVKMPREGRPAAVSCSLSNAGGNVMVVALPIQGPVWTAGDEEAGEKEEPLQKHLFSIRPEGTWPLSEMTLRASLGDSTENQSPTRETSSNDVSIVVKPEGWREARYRQYVAFFDEKMREKARPHEFEFPEARKLKPAVITADTMGAEGRIEMNVDRLVVVDEKAKIARLRNIKGSFTIFAGDPYSPPEEKPVVSGADGLVLVWFVCDTQNKWWNQKAYELCREMLDELKENPLPEPVLAVSDEESEETGGKAQGAKQTESVPSVESASE